MNITSFSRYFVTLFCLLTFLPVVAQIEVERLPDLNIPRAGHSLFYVNGEYVAAGGHTDGFVPTPTAEYFKDGKWHTMQMTYTHDTGFSLVLRSGKVLMAGGCEQPLGIGQTYTAEIYDPETHTFRGFGNMQQKRVMVSALELDSGKVVIAGNWYNTDGIELFHEQIAGSGDYRGKSSFTYIKDVTVQRATPYIFQIAKDDALIFGTNGVKGDTLHCTLADRLKGDTVHIPLFNKWQPVIIDCHHDEDYFIGDVEKGDYTYLLPVQDSTGQVAIAKVSGTDISLLSTASSVPMHYQGEQIMYTYLIADRHTGRAYLMGINRNHHIESEKVRLFILCIEYAQASDDNGASLHLYYIDQLGDMAPSCAPVLTPEGNLLIAGGYCRSSNFTPSAAVWLLRTGQDPTAASGSSWVLILLGVIVMAIIFLLYIIWQKKRHTVSLAAKEHDSITKDFELLHRICRLMEEQKLYLNSDLKLGDIAIALATNRNAISSCINSQRGCSFTQFVNTYRINHAKDLLRHQPDIKIIEVWTASGFTTESYFFRAFKAITGMTPSEWKQKNN